MKRPLLLLLALAAAPARAGDAATGAERWIRTETRLEPGVTRIDLRRESPPCDVRMVAFDRAALPGLRFHVREAGGGLFATRAVPDLAKELEETLAPFGARRTVAGVNGDFFDNGGSSPTFGLPNGPVVENRELLTTGLLVPEILYAQPQTMLYEWRDRAARRELRVGRLVFRGTIRPGILSGAPAVTNEFRLVNPLLLNLDPDPAKQPAELAVFTARWTKPLPAPGVRVRYVPFLRKEQPTGLLAPYGGCGGVEILGPVKKGDKLSGDPLEGAIVGLGAAAETAKGLLAFRRSEKRTGPKPFYVADDLYIHGGFDRDPGVGEDFFVVEEAVRPWTIPMRDGTIVPTHEVENYPRTLVGLGPGKIVLFVADGRSSRSRSLPSREAAELLAAEGCTDAVQFDGGGSATLLAGGEVLNRPSDGRPRKVANGLFLTLPVADISHAEPAEFAED